MSDGFPVDVPAIPLRVVLFVQMFKNYIEPPRFTDEEKSWAAFLLKTRGSRLAKWDEYQYLTVLEDLYGRLRDDGAAMARKLAQGHRGTNLEVLDTYVVNCSAIGIVRGLLKVPPLPEQSHQ